MTEFQHIQYNQEAELAIITLNRPEKLNALTPLMMRELRACLEEIQQGEGCRVVVVTGAGRAFSAGVDLEVFQESKVEPGYDMHEDGMAVMHLLETMNPVCIAKVNGYCFTGAMELMMAFDLVYAAAEAKIGDTHSKWGIPPKWGMTQRLARHVGLLKAKELSFTAEALSGVEAEHIGLVNKAVPLDELDGYVKQQIEKILQNSDQAIGLIKNLYNEGFRRTLAEGIQYELDLSVEITDKTQELRTFKKNL